MGAALASPRGRPEARPSGIGLGALPQARGCRARGEHFDSWRSRARQVRCSGRLGVPWGASSSQETPSRCLGSARKRALPKHRHGIPCRQQRTWRGLWLPRVEIRGRQSIPRSRCNHSARVILYPSAPPRGLRPVVAACHRPAPSASTSPLLPRFFLPSPPPPPGTPPPPPGLFERGLSQWGPKGGTRVTHGVHSRPEPPAGSPRACWARGGDHLMKRLPHQLNHKLLLTTSVW